MNARQLAKLGVPPHCVPAAIVAVQSAASAGLGKQIKSLLGAVLAQPTAYRDDPLWGPLAMELTEVAEYPPREPVDFQIWGEAGIDEAAKQQMRQACRLPMAVGGALMPDAHVGYGLPIGGVLALEGAVCPYAVGVDIACRMRLSVLDLPAEWLTGRPRYQPLEAALEKGTRFGVGAVHQQRQQHAVLDQDWSVSRITRENKDKAWAQLGTSGSGNHFVEFGLLTLGQPSTELGLEAGRYVALLSHSGSRGTGAAVCQVYSNLARTKLPRRWSDLDRLAWLDLASEEGQQYWQAMNLMGDYAAANHEVIHRLVGQAVGSRTLATVENHHNFAWREVHDGREVIVHRKGATPAAPGELGVIPGSMADPGYVVRGLGNPSSWNSASHGAGRQLSRTAARQKYRWNAVRSQLAQQGVHVVSAGADEVPGAYKDIEQVMQAQRDLVEVVARFDPKVVKMCGDNSPAED